MAFARGASIDHFGFDVVARRSSGNLCIQYMDLRMDFENLDCLSMNLHDDLKYCKFGYGRATDQSTRASSIHACVTTLRALRGAF